MGFAIYGKTGVLGREYADAPLPPPLMPGWMGEPKPEPMGAAFMLEPEKTFSEWQAEEAARQSLRVCFAPEEPPLSPTGGWDE